MLLIIYVQQIRAILSLQEVSLPTCFSRNQEQLSDTAGRTTLAGSQGVVLTIPRTKVAPKARDYLVQNVGSVEVKKPLCDLVYNIASDEPDILIRE